MIDFGVNVEHSHAAFNIHAKLRISRDGVHLLMLAILRIVIESFPEIASVPLGLLQRQSRRHKYHRHPHGNVAEKPAPSVCTIV